MASPPVSYVIAIPVFEGVNLMDIAAPREIFSFVNVVQPLKYIVHISFVANAKFITTFDGLCIKPDYTFDDEEVSKPDLLWIPGGSPDALSQQLANTNSPFFEYIKKVGPEVEYACSVCEGAVLFAASGLLDGYCATTHWNFYPCMTAYPKVKMVAPQEEGSSGTFIYPRYIIEEAHCDDDKKCWRVTGGGITSGIDEALFLVGKIFGDDIAQGVADEQQYAPSPPVTAILGKADQCPIPFSNLTRHQPPFTVMAKYIVAIPVYNGVDLMDLSAPREIFHDASLVLGKNPGEVKISCVADDNIITTSSGVKIVPNNKFCDTTVANPTVMWIPGGSSTYLGCVLKDLNSSLFKYIKKVGSTAEYACSVCNGAVLFAASGLLDGCYATTHWQHYPCMTAYPKVKMVKPQEEGSSGIFTYPRYILNEVRPLYYIDEVPKRRWRVTGGGITSGLDESLCLVAMIFSKDVAQSTANMTQYAPNSLYKAKLGLNDSCPIPKL